MKYCINCGEKLPDKAKFCAYCGSNVGIVIESIPEQVPEKPEQPKASHSCILSPVQDGVPHLHPGEQFFGYRIVNILNRDPEGVKYVVTKLDSGDRQYLLKIFYKSSTEDIEMLYGLQIRLQCLKYFSHPHIAPIVEINDSLTPGFIVSEFVDGVSLAELKASNPNRLTENLVRRIAVQLVSAAVYIRQNGLTMYNLSPVGIILDDNDDIRVLISGIAYEDVDEREDVFTTGMILAQLLCHSPFYYTIYGKDRLKEHKFAYISDVTVSMNKVVAECLHRNILQRYTTLTGLARDLDKLPPVSQDQIWSTMNGKELDEYVIVTDDHVPKPKSAIDYRFGILLLVIVSAIVILFTVWDVRYQTDVPATIPVPGDSLIDDQANRDRRQEWNVTTGRDVPVTGYGDTRTIDRRRDRVTQGLDTRSTAPTNGSTPAASPVKTPSRPVNMAFISATKFPYGVQEIEVSLSAFYIGKHEVTQAEWNRHMRPANVSRRGDDLPVDNVTWYEVIEYCNRRSIAEGLKPVYTINGNARPLDWRRGQISCDWSANGYRLPTEAEWELAALAGSYHQYSGSNILNDIAWYSGNAGGRIQNVGGKKPNVYGVHDLTGNVAEWCWDWFDVTYVRNLQDTTDPKGPDTGNAKIIRGGSIFESDTSRLNLRTRDRRDPGRGYPFIGFRVVRTN